MVKVLRDQNVPPGSFNSWAKEVELRKGISFEGGGTIEQQLALWYSLPVQFPRRQSRRLCALPHLGGECASLPVQALVLLAGWLATHWASCSDRGAQCCPTSVSLPFALES